MAEFLRKTANAKLPDVQGRGPTRLVTSLYASATGGAWVGGTVVLTDAELSFSANAMNRATHKGTLDVSFPVDRIIGAAIIGGLGTKIIAVRMTNDEVFEFRCNRATDVLAAIEKTVS